MCVVFQEQKASSTRSAPRVLDRQKYPCFALCEDAIEKGFNFPCALSGADEAAVDLYVDLIRDESFGDLGDERRGYLTELYDVDKLYHLSDNTGQILDENGSLKLFTDIAVIDLRPYISDSYDAAFWKRKYTNNGYEIVKEIEDVILILEIKK